MASSRQQVSSQRPSWRQSPVRGEAASYSGSKTPLRVLMTLVVASLLGALLWLWWQPVKPVPPTHFLAITTGESDLLSVPPILFEQQTLAPLEELGKAQATLVYRPKVGIESAAPELRQIQIKPEDRLIVYVSAHGVSEDGNAYVLAPSYDLLDPGAGRYAATDLIKSLKDSTAATKLLVLDCSRLATLPRMGMAVNEFVSLVKAAAQDANDPNLWVMTAGDELETSPLGLAAHRSILGGALVDGLGGAPGGADAAPIGNGDQDVSMAELMNYVAQQCAQAPVAAPKPQLFYCGTDTDLKDGADRIILRLAAKGLSEDAARIMAKAQAKITPKKAAAPLPQPVATAFQPPTPVPATATTTAAQPSGVATTAAPPPSASGPPQAAPQGTPQSPDGANPSPAVTSVAASPPDGGPAPSATPPAPAGDVPSATPAATAVASDQNKTTLPQGAELPPIIKTWRLRDQLQDASDGVYSPVEYAPHLWNKLNAALVALHLKRIGLSVADQKISPYQQGLELLAGGQAAIGNELIVTDELRVALGQFKDGGAIQGLASPHEKYTEGLLVLRRFTFRANQYVQWHAADPASAGAALATITQLLEDLALLDKSLANLEERRLDSSDRSGPLIDAIESRCGRVHDTARVLDRSIADLIATLDRNESAATQRIAESLLMTCVATAEQKQSLAKIAETSPVAKVSNPTVGQWKSALDHLRLEVQLVKLVDPAKEFSPSLEALLSSPDISSPGPKVRTEVRAAGEELREFYANLPTQISRSWPSIARLADLRAAARMVAVVHPVDASDRSQPLDATVGFISPMLASPAQLKLDPPSPLTLTAISGERAPLVWTVNVQGAGGAELKATVGQFNQNRLSVYISGRSRAITPGTSVPLDPDSSPSLRLEVAANPNAESLDAPLDERIPLTVKISTDAGDMEDTRSAQVRILPPSRVDLIANRVEPRRPEEPQSEGVTLHPYPNRDTTFELQAVNRSGEAKECKVELIVITAPVDAAIPPGMIFNRDGNVDPEIAAWGDDAGPSAMVVASYVVNFPANNTPQDLVFLPPKTAEPAEPKPAEEPKDKPPGEVKPPPEIDVTQGLLCRITNSTRPNDIHLKWIEILPMRPDSYLDLEGEILPDRREFSFHSRLGDFDSNDRGDRPPGLEENPVSFLVQGDGTQFRARATVRNAIKTDNADANIVVDVLPTSPEQVDIPFDIDGFPRAAVWSVNFTNNQVKQVYRNSISIDRVGMSADDRTPARLYLTSPFGRVTFDEKDEKEKPWGSPVIVDGERVEERVCAFDVSRNARPIEVKLRVDAPLNAFSSIGGGDSVTVSWGDENSRSKYAGRDVHLSSDREVTSKLVAVTEQGHLTIHTSVRDFTIPLDPLAEHDETVRLSARLEVQGGQPEFYPVWIVFDDAPPKINSVVLEKRRIEKGVKQMVVRLNAEDRSGIARVEAWVLLKRPLVPEDLKPDSAESLDFEFQPFRPHVIQEANLQLNVTVPQELGGYFLVLRVTDRSGQSTTTLGMDREFEVFKPEPPPILPVFGDLKGRVTLNGKAPAPSIKVEIKELPGVIETTDDEGVFVFKRLKEGDYTLLLVEGQRINGRPVAAEEQKITLKEKPVAEWRAALDAKIEWQEPQKE